MNKKQLNLFREAPTKIRYVKELPDCGICKKTKADFHAPTKFSIWADFCKGCASTNTDYRFNLGVKLALQVKFGGPLLDIIEVNDISMVVTGIKPRVIACEVCKTKREVKEDFSGAIICRGCLSRLRVNKL